MTAIKASVGVKKRSLLGGLNRVISGYRYYSSKLGRWISRDPIGERGGLNFYAFVGNNPIDAVDLFGLAEPAVDYTTRAASEVVKHTPKGKVIPFPGSATNAARTASIASRLNVALIFFTVLFSAPEAGDPEADSMVGVDAISETVPHYNNDEDDDPCTVEILRGIQTKKKNLINGVKTHLLSKADLRPQAFRFDQDGISFFETQHLVPSANHPFVLPLTVKHDGKKISGAVGFIVEIPGQQARYSPGFGPGHWSVLAPSEVVSSYAKSVQFTRIRLNHVYIGESPRLMDR